MTSNPSFPPIEQRLREATRRLYRSRSDRVLAGICGGLAEHFGSDPAIVRLGVVILAILTGIVPMLVLYIVAAIVIPEGTAGAEAVDRPARVNSGGAALLFGLFLIVVGLAAFAREFLQVNWELLWPLALIAMGGALLLWAVRRPAAPGS